MEDENKTKRGRKREKKIHKANRMYKGERQMEKEKEKEREKKNMKERQRQITWLHKNHPSKKNI